MKTLLCRGGVLRDCGCGHVWSAMGFSLVGVHVHVWVVGVCTCVCSAVGLWVLYMCVIVGVYMCVIVGVYVSGVPRLPLQPSSGYAYAQLC